MTETQNVTSYYHTEDLEYLKALADKTARYITLESNNTKALKDTQNTLFKSLVNNHPVSKEMKLQENAKESEEIDPRDKTTMLTNFTKNTKPNPLLHITTI